MTKKRYLVTGAAGRLGTKFVEIVSQKNIDDVTDLRLLDLNFSEAVKRKHEEACTEAKINVEWITGSITDQSILRSALQDVDVVVHMASIIDFRDELPRSKLWKVNVQGTKNLIDVCCQCNVSHFVYTSSMETVGPNVYRDPMYNGNEDTHYRVKHAMFYGETKHEAENLVLAANGRKLEDGKRLTTCALRPGEIYGGLDYEILIETARDNLKSKTLPSPSDPSHLFSRIYIDNAAWCHVLAAKQIQMIASTIGGNAYYIGDDTPKLAFARLNQIFLEPFGFKMHQREPILPFWIMYTFLLILFYVKGFLRVLGFSTQVKICPGALKVVCTCFTFSHGKFQEHFGYKPLKSWEETLEETRKHMGIILKEIESHS
ncbi:unnamed protein product [Clavelina lepadiformis]|uniref:3-beta hydroxysteroid dehydrogenase/isomerase domain-containing protein n=1 Tax=Clavelina lepadiformis TaxID=159417 RepID=A0ABP0G5F1_CLALP